MGELHDGTDGEPAGDRLGEFVRTVESRNPFLDNRINGPSANDVDVDAIHQAAFGRLTRLAHEACDHHRGVGVVLWGEAGIGKSHLLSRLARWANRDNQAYLVYLHNLQAAPEHLPRSLLGTVLNILTRGRDRHFVGTPLFEMVHACLLDAVEHRMGDYTWAQLEHSFRRLVERLAASDLPGATLVDGSVWNVLFAFYRSAYRANQGREPGTDSVSAVRWLSGQTLDPGEAQALRLPPPRRADEAIALLDNQQIKQVLVALSELAASEGKSFLLVFDQVDNLDAEQAGALARFLEALIDSSPNLLVVTAGVKDTLVSWHEDRVIQESAWDRLAQLEITLQRLKPAEAVAIIEARLWNFLEPFADIALVQRQRRENVLFPLGEAWRQRFFGDRIEIRPRDALNWAREGWRQQQESLARHDPHDWLTRWPRDGEPGPGPPDEPTTEEIEGSIDRRIAEKLAALSEQLLREPHTLPSDADHLAGLTYSLLAQCRDAGHRYGVRELERVPPPKNARPTYHLLLRRRDCEGSADTRTGIVFLMERSATAVTGFLRRLLADWGAFDRIVMTTAEHIGLPLGQAGRDYLDDLQRRGGEHFQKMELTFAEIVELDAMQRVVGLAKSGDLEIELRPSYIRAVTEQEVIESYVQHGRYLGSRLLRTLLDSEEDREAMARLRTVLPQN
jgi:hypothetical protein